MNPSSHSPELSIDTMHEFWQDLECLSYPHFIHDSYFALASIHADAKRQGIVKVKAGCNIVCVLTPAQFDISTHAHEYGGQCFCFHGDDVYFFDITSKSVYRHNVFGEDITAHKINDATIEDNTIAALADLNISEDGRFLTAVAEFDADTQYAKSAIVIFDLHMNSGGKVLIEGNDFYASPRITQAENGQYLLAYITWSLAAMPWDENIAYMVTLNSHAQILEDTSKLINSNSQSSVSQLGWMAGQRLVFAMDSDAQGEDFSNLYCYQKGILKTLTSLEGEIGQAHWQFGQSRWQGINEQNIVAVVTMTERDFLYQINMQTGHCQRISGDEVVSIKQLACRYNQLMYVAQYADKAPAIVALNLTSKPHKFTTIFNGKIKKSVIGQHITYPCRDTQTAHAFLYLPKLNTHSQQKPPLICMIHGGPTGRADLSYHPVKQFFVSMGFAVLDINHRGSTGYGRKYRQALLNHWGTLEVSDTVDAINYCVQNGYVDPNRIFIRGSSAGGYSVLCALTDYADIFTAAGVYYGIGDLATLAKITHKFEATYTDRLIGETYNEDTVNLPSSEFFKRSPIHRLNEIKAGIIWFQGAKDNVVPESLSSEFIRQLKQNSIPHAYYVYPEEAHGFRDNKNKMQSLLHEIQFYLSY